MEALMKDKSITDEIEANFVKLSHDSRKDIICALFGFLAQQDKRELIATGAPDFLESAQ
jgi:hypothetical protein